jgi:ankyrin repeat protein
MLCNIDEEDITEARLVLTLLCVSDRPLTVKELIGALAIDVSKLQLDREGRSFSQEDLLDICLGLIELAVVEDEESGEANTIARIAHFSVQEYLESDRISQHGAAKFTIQMEPAHTEMAQICLTYLLDPTHSKGEFNKAKLEMFPFGRFAAMQWFHSYNHSGKGKPDIEPLILRLFKDQPESFVTWVQLYDFDHLLDPYYGIDFDTVLDQGDDFIGAMEYIQSPLYYAVLLRLEYVFATLISSFGNETTIDAALNTQKLVCEKVVQTLLDHGAGVNAQGGYFGNALQAASCGLFRDSVEEEYQQEVVDEKMMQTLLDHGADVNAQGGVYGNALQAASYVGREKVVRTLLDQGADVNAQGGEYGNALQAASYGRHEKVVRTLLNHGADVNAQGGAYGNALQAASYVGHEKVVRTLLDQGADVNALGGSYGNALQAATRAGREKVVQILLDRGADINALGGSYGNALQAATWAGREKVVQTLLDRGGDVNAEDGGKYGNALQSASYRGHEKVVQILLHHGADVNAEGGEYGNALGAALQEGHEKLVQILLENGAKPEPIV